MVADDSGKCGIGHRGKSTWRLDLLLPCPFVTLTLLNCSLPDLPELCSHELGNPALCKQSTAANRSNRLPLRRQTHALPPTETHPIFCICISYSLSKSRFDSKVTFFLLKKKREKRERQRKQKNKRTKPPKKPIFMIPSWPSRPQNAHLPFPNSSKPFSSNSHVNIFRVEVSIH